jgi:hypothetical protein
MEDSGDESHPATPQGNNNCAEELQLHSHGVVLHNKQDANSSSQVSPYSAILETSHTYVSINGIRKITYLITNYRKWKKQVHEPLHVQFLSKT